MAKSYITQEVFENILMSLLHDAGYEAEVIEIEGKIGPERKLVQKDRPEYSCTVAVRIDELYEDYMKGIKHGHPVMMDTVVNEVIEAFNTSLPTGYNPDRVNKIMKSWEEVRQRLFLNVYNRYRNHDYIKGHVFEYIADLALVAKICISRANGQTCSCLVDEDMLKKWGVTKEEVMAEAKKNAENIVPAIFGSTQEVAEIMMSNALENNAKVDMLPALALMACPPAFHVITTINNDTAAALFYDGMMEKIADEFNGFFFVIPSSNKELLILPGDDFTTPEELSSMIQEVNNSGCVPKDEILSDHAYIYKNKKFSPFV